MKEERRFSWKTIALILFFAGLIYLLFASGPLLRWSGGLNSLQGRLIFSRILSLPDRLARSLGIEGYVPEAQDWFHQQTDRTFRDFFESAGGEAPGHPPGARSGEILPADSPGDSVLAGPGEPPSQGTSEVREDQEDWGLVTEQILFPQGRIIPPPQAPSAPRGRVLIIGDSMANSCYRALVPIQRRFPELELVTYTRVSANLCNELFDQWFRDLETFAADRRFDIILILLGANAVQPLTFMDQHYSYNTPEWIWFYKQKAADMLDKIRTPETRICWVGLPPMFGRSYRDNMVRHNQLLREICRTNGISFFPIEYILGDGDGLYTDYKIIGGRQVKIRDSDKIHYTAAGEALLAEYLIGELFPGYYAEGN